MPKALLLPTCHLVGHMGSSQGNLSAFSGPSQVENYSPGNMEEAPSRGHKARLQSGVGVHATNDAPAAKIAKGSVGRVYLRRRGA